VSARVPTAEEVAHFDALYMYEAVPVPEAGAGDGPPVR
jgi:hypothetical protein